MYPLTKICPLLVLIHPNGQQAQSSLCEYLIISILTLINTTYLQLIKSYTEYFLDLNACCKVAVNWNRRYLVSGGDNIFFIVVYFWLTFSVQSKSCFSVRFSLQHFHVESSVLSLHGCVWLEQQLTCSLFKDHGNFGLLQKNHVKQKKVIFV